MMMFELVEHMHKLVIVQFVQVVDILLRYRVF